jgi:peptidoglycan hydrolase-like amidase
MNIFSKPARLAPSLALILAVLCSGFFELFALTARAAAAQKSKSGDPERQARDEDSSRPRRIGDGSGGPIIRIGLMTDVASVSLSSPGGLNLRRLMTNNRDEGKHASSAIRVEVRQQSLPATPSRSQLRVEAAVASDARDARKIIDDLKKKFYEPAQMTYDPDSDKYQVLIGRFSAPGDAAEMVERLRRLDYRDARVISEQPERSQGASAEPGYKPRSRYTEAVDRSNHNPALERVQQVVAFEANKLIVSSEDLLIAAAADDAQTPRLGDTETRGQKSSDRNRAKDQTDANDSPRLRVPASPRQPRVVRVGNKDYRGEIHLVLNRRGRINVINSLPMEDYLRGVVPMELSPTGFPELEALKAQAVAARTYALSQRGRFGSEGFDLNDTAQSQVYGGFSAEHPMTNRAVEETRGMVAIYFGEDGRGSPIEALYTSTCGGQTENNESIFLGPALPYLRSVQCAPDHHAVERRQINSTRTAEPLAGADGRQITREVALLEVLGFPIPNRVTAGYLRGATEHAELLRWADRVAALSHRERPRAPRGDITRLPAFAQLMASAVYGEGRASLLLSPADIEYFLSGLVEEEVPEEMRGDLAMLLRDGVLRLPADSRAGAKTAVTRAFAIEAFARALTLKSDTQSLKSQTAKPAENNRLVISQAPPAKADAQSQEPSINKVKEAAGGPARAEGSANRQEGLEVERGAWLFRKLGDVSYAVPGLMMVGGERVTYHLNAAGRVDFLEAEVSERGAASDRFSAVSRWQERVSADDLRRRLARARISVGEIEELVATAHGPSNRVLELEVIGREGRSRLRGYQIRNALGLKENLFVLDTLRDEQGRVVAFTFVGRGWGHGVGMCQTGAYGLAKEGYSYIAILQKYYTGVKVQSMY